MFSLFLRAATFAGRHWLQLCFAGLALFLLTQRQIAFNVSFGGNGEAVPTDYHAPAPPPPDEQRPTAPASDLSELNDEPTLMTEAEPAPVVAEAGGGFFSRLNIFGGAGEATLSEHLQTVADEDVRAFIRRFSHVAQAEQEKFGIPASIVLASGLLHSKAGTGAGVEDFNAYFDLPCDQEWRGSTGRVAGTCVRAYQNAWTAFRDHSLYLTSGRYQRLTQFGPNDYRRWALGMEELGVSAEEDFAGQLLGVVDRWQLFQYD